MRTKKLLIIILVLFLVVSFFMVSILSACRDERRCTRCGYLEGHHLDSPGHVERCVCCREGWPCIYPD